MEHAQRDVQKSDRDQDRTASHQHFAQTRRLIGVQQRGTQGFPHARRRSGEAAAAACAARRAAATKFDFFAWRGNDRRPGEIDGGFRRGYALGRRRHSAGSGGAAGFERMIGRQKGIDRLSRGSGAASPPPRRSAAVPQAPIRAFGHLFGYPLRARLAAPVQVRARDWFARRFRLRRALVHPALDHRQPVDDMLDGAVHGFQRILGAPLAAFDFGDITHDGLDGDGLGRRDGRHRAAAAADLVDMDEQVGEPALDCFEIAEPRVRMHRAA